MYTHVYSYTLMYTYICHPYAQGILARLRAKGWRVFPAREGENDRFGFEGGQIIRRVAAWEDGWKADAMDIYVPQDAVSVCVYVCMCM
jgi:hypothetical protein